MTFEERLANLGVEVRDIEITYDNDQLYEILNKQHPVGEMQELEITRKYLEAVEIIDRLETRLDNVYHDSIETIDKLTQIVDALNGKIKELSGGGNGKAD